jgi:acyl-CoA thioesterase FadM
MAMAMISASRRLHWSSLLVLAVLSLYVVISVNAFSTGPIFAGSSRHGGGSCGTRKHRSFVVVNAVSPASPASAASTTTTLHDDAPTDLALVTISIRHTQPVYIEDTDAYGVMYNGNYLRAYDRALHTANNTGTDARQVNSSINNGMNMVVDDQWSTVAVQRQKFKSSPALGETFAVTATLRAIPDGGSEMWDMNMQAATAASCDNENDDYDTEDVDNKQVKKATVTVYNTATGVTIARPPNQQQQQQDNNKANNDNTNTGNRPTPAWLPEPPPLEPTSKAASDKEIVSTFTVFRDEFDSHLDGHLPLRSVLNLFERARSDCLGGPDQLRRLQEQDSILFVVVAIDDLSLVRWNPGTSAAATDTNTVVTPDDQRRQRLLSAGQQVQVTTDYVVKRSGMILECQQTAWVQGSRMAQGVVTLMALNAQTRRPTSKLPVWLRQELLK